MYYVGLDIHKKTISYCIKDASGPIHSEGKVGATARELDAWIKTVPQPWTVAMEATIFTGWIYDHLLPHAAQVKVAHPLMLRAIAAAKAYIGQAARFVGQQAVQLHGAIGVVDDLIVSHYFKRLTMIDMTFGDSDFHFARFSDSGERGAAHRAA